jgi:lysozyme
MTRVLGVDVSWWQGPMEWQTTKEVGAGFAFIRAGSCNSVDGTNYTDFQFENNAEFAPEHLPVGFYWYFRPNFSPAGQANYFCDLIEPETWVLPPVLDLETTGGKSAAGVTNAAAEFIAQVYARLSVWPIVYSRSYFLHDLTVDNELWHECDLWIARYTNKAEPWGNPNDNPKTKPPYWNDWMFWQYVANSDAAVKYGGAGPPNGDDDIDLNYFNGDAVAFKEYIGAPPPPTFPLPDDIGVKVDIDGIKYRGRIELVVE